MDSIEDLVALVRDELGLPVSTTDTGRELDEIPGWDSVHLLTLATILERTTGQRLSLPDVLEATSLERLYALTTGR
ncbi:MULTISPECIES: acyl carrier protein [unclassified Frankia]|uniref:acyl carrier protein n=1 Tax=unclassified Frankia TaxID=2632575 RepID=UPI002023F784